MSPLALAVVAAVALLDGGLGVDVLWVFALSSVACGLLFAVRAWREVQPTYVEYGLHHPAVHAVVAFMCGMIVGPLMAFGLGAVILLLAAPSLLLTMLLRHLGAW